MAEPARPRITDATPSTAPTEKEAKPKGMAWTVPATIQGEIRRVSSALNINIADVRSLIDPLAMKAAETALSGKIGELCLAEQAKRLKAATGGGA